MLQNLPSVKKLARQGIEYILSSKQTRRPLLLLLPLSFFYGVDPPSVMNLAGSAVRTRPLGLHPLTTHLTGDVAPSEQRETSPICTVLNTYEINFL